MNTARKLDIFYKEPLLLFSLEASRNGYRFPLAFWPITRQSRVFVREAQPVAFPSDRFFHELFLGPSFASIDDSSSRPRVSSSVSREFSAFRRSSDGSNAVFSLWMFAQSSHCSFLPISPRYGVIFSESIAFSFVFFSSSAVLSFTTVHPWVRASATLSHDKWYNSDVRHLDKRTAMVLHKLQGYSRCAPFIRVKLLEK